MTSRGSMWDWAGQPGTSRCSKLWVQPPLLWVIWVFFCTFSSLMLAPLFGEWGGGALLDLVGSPGYLE